MNTSTIIINVHGTLTDCPAQVDINAKTEPASQYSHNNHHNLFSVFGF
jgi:hypothetical protein